MGTERHAERFVTENLIGSKEVMSSSNAENVIQALHFGTRKSGFSEIKFGYQYTSTNTQMKNIEG